MDSQQFVNVSEPNYYRAAKINVNQVFIEKQIGKPTYALNTRFPGYAPMAEDANIFTDYRPNCANNIPSGQQFASQQWFQHNAENIIKISRERQAKSIGANFLHADTVPPPVAIVKCGIDKCAYYPGPSPSPNSVPTGIERDDKAPPLFGTFDFAYKPAPPSPKQLLNRKNEGGRNSPRGTSSLIKA